MTGSFPAGLPSTAENVLEETAKLLILLNLGAREAPLSNALPNGTGAEAATASEVRRRPGQAQGWPASWTSLSRPFYWKEQLTDERFRLCYLAEVFPKVGEVDGSFPRVAGDKMSASKQQLEC